MKTKSKKKSTKKASTGEPLFDLMIKKQPELLSNILKDDNYYVYQDENLDIIKQKPDGSLVIVKKHGDTL
jgi:hypothetical protein